MEDKQFDEPVHVQLKPGKIRAVTWTSQAAKALLYEWPEKRGRRHRTARQACLDVMSGLKDARAARKAFTAAAEEADVLVPISRIVKPRR
ncbi:DUF982 domain-containing protein [Mesorhizobium marinum]|uniref:DUF982 domain-containing protein n=1 Tax=Mesorhizobium marinum TaxID=3228790 RepID=A0ABV3R5K2_9HYPH